MPRSVRCLRRLTPWKAPAWTSTVRRAGGFGSARAVSRRGGLGSRPADGGALLDATSFASHRRHDFCRACGRVGVQSLADRSPAGQTTLVTLTAGLVDSRRRLPAVFATGYGLRSAVSCKRASPISACLVDLDAVGERRGHRAGLWRFERDVTFATSPAASANWAAAPSVRLGRLPPRLGRPRVVRHGRLRRQRGYHADRRAAGGQERRRAQRRTGGDARCGRHRGRLRRDDLRHLRQPRGHRRRQDTLLTGRQHNRGERGLADHGRRGL